MQADICRVAPFFLVTHIAGIHWRNRMGRERRNHENLTARFPEGTLVRIERALRGREGKADFIRAAVSEKLARRERNLPAEGASLGGEDDAEL